MKRHIQWALVAGLCVAAAATADPFDPAKVPEKTRWFVHADLKRFKETQLGAQILKQLAPLSPALELVEKATGLDPRRDLSGVTLVGLGAKGDEVVVLFSGQFQQEKLKVAVRGAKEHRELAYGGHALHSWRDDKGAHYGCVYDARTVLMGDGQPALLALLDVLDKKSPACKPHEVLARLGKGEEPFTLLALADMEAFGKLEPQANLLEKLKLMCLAVGEHRGDFTARLLVQPCEASAAVSVQQALQGLVAIVQLGDSKKPEIRRAQELAQRLKIEQADPYVSVRLDVPVKEVLETLKIRLEAESTAQGKGSLKLELKLGDPPAKPLPPK